MENAFISNWITNLKENCKMDTKICHIKGGIFPSTSKHMCVCLNQYQYVIIEWIKRLHIRTWHFDMAISIYYPSIVSGAFRHTWYSPVWLMSTHNFMNAEKVDGWTRPRAFNEMHRFHFKWHLSIFHILYFVVDYNFSTEYAISVQGIQCHQCDESWTFVMVLSVLKHAQFAL